ncbi:MAG TPA: hypothetical protein VKK79_17685, partial [Candidatus Lokiarchaeia archaeon]|nr:hypothetical protein [Candidatus Lokiarchaeia archaeon]
PEEESPQNRRPPDRGSLLVIKDFKQPSWGREGSLPGQLKMLPGEIGQLSAHSQNFFKNEQS